MDLTNLRGIGGEPLGQIGGLGSLTGLLGLDQNFQPPPQPENMNISEIERQHA